MGNIFYFKQPKSHHSKWTYLQLIFLCCVSLKATLETIFFLNNFQNNLKILIHREQQGLHSCLVKAKRRLLLMKEKCQWFWKLLQNNVNILNKMMGKGFLKDEKRISDNPPVMLVQWQKCGDYFNSKCTACVGREKQPCDTEYNCVIALLADAWSVIPLNRYAYVSE